MELFDHPYRQKNIFVARSYNVPTAIASEACRFIVEESDLDTKDLYPAFIEMMTNATQHAYDEETKLDKKWQIFIQKNFDGIRVIFLDTGKGIPGTVKKTKMERMKEVFSILMNVDEKMILKSAFDGEFRSSTGEKNRGNGLPQIYKVMLKKYVKSAIVYTGRVSCTVVNGREPEYFETEGDFFGTLYELNISRRFYETAK